MLSEKSKEYIRKDLLSGLRIHAAESQLSFVLAFIRTNIEMKDYKLVLTKTTVGKETWGIKLFPKEKGE